MPRGCSPPRSRPSEEKKKKASYQNRYIMLKYFYNNEIEFLEVDPEFVELGLKYALKKALKY